MASSWQSCGKQQSPDENAAAVRMCVAWRVVGSRRRCGECGGVGHHDKHGCQQPLWQAACKALGSSGGLNTYSSCGNVLGGGCCCLQVVAVCSCCL